MLMGMLVPDSPMQAKWLNTAEKVVLLKHVSVNRTGVRSKGFVWRQVGEALGDVQVWGMVLATILVSFCLFCAFCLSTVILPPIIHIQ